ncbi:serine/threonine-protein kinase [Apiospora arundinis]|uniref:Serine/threonine-protein kinase n=1 Tax=Apiospora arundinis TaxID=335852 RepID=A0ABR2JGL0_9PEZI
MEPVGLVASVVTLVAIVDKTVDCVRDIRRQWKDAPAEINALAKLLDDLQSLLKSFEQRSNGKPHQYLSNAIVQTRKCAEELVDFLDTKILVGRTKESSVQIKAAWMLHRRRINLLRETLSEAQVPLHLGLLLSQDSRLDRIETLLLTQVSENGALVALTESTSQLTTVVDSSRLTRAAPTGRNDGTTHVKPLSQGFSRSLQPYSTQARQIDPGSSLECSRNFIPETYMVEWNKLVFYDSMEILHSNNRRDVYYSLIIAHRRQYTRVKLHMEVNRDSIYWPALRAKPANIGYRKAYEPPATLMDDLQRFLHGKEDLPQDARIDLFLGHQKDKFRINSNPPERRRTQQYLQKVSETAKHMKCPRFKERELMHCGVSWKYEAVRLLAKCPSGWAIHVRFDARDDHMDEEFYALQVLYALHQENGFGSFLGLVEDDNNTVTGFLCRNPSRGPLLDAVFRAKQNETVVYWPLRERWCRQIIDGVSALHSHGYRHGSLGRFLRNGLCTDEDNNVIFLNSFRDSFTYADDMQDLSIPPECRRMENTSSDGSPLAIPVQPATDTYQLGLILWCIAANEEAVYRSTVHEVRDHDDDESRANFDNTQQLPPIDPSTAPPYMNRIIAMCRAEKPEDRPPVWKLAEEFPLLKMSEKTHSTGSGSSGWMKPMTTNQPRRTTWSPGPSTSAAATARRPRRTTTTTAAVALSRSTMISALTASRRGTIAWMTITTCRSCGRGSRREGITLVWVRTGNGRFLSVDARDR